MKRLMIGSLAVLCVAAFLPRDLSAGFGIKVGSSLSKFSTTAPYDLLNLPSPVGGVYFSLKLGPLAIQPEVLYVRMGAKYEFEDLKMEWRFDYIQVPVILKLSVIPLGPIRPVIYAGGYGSYLLKAKGIEGAGPGVDMSEDYQKYDYGLVGGAGLDFKLLVISISIEARYNYGLRNIWIPLDPDDATSWKNRSMMALVGIAF